MLVATSGSFTAAVEEAGLPAAAAGIDWTEARVEEAFPAASNLSGPLRGTFIGRIFQYEHPRAFVGDALNLIRDWGADIVVNVPVEHGGQLAAELAGIPWALANYMLLWLDFPGRVPEQRSEQSGLEDIREGRFSVPSIRRELGLPHLRARDREPPLASRFLTLDQVPPSLQFWDARAIFRTPWPMRPIPYSPPSSDDEWEWLEALPSGPRVFVTLGTVFAQERAVFRAILEGLADEQCTVLLHAEEDLGPLPDNVHARPFFPVDRVLPVTDLVVGHGGWGTTIAALAHGVPTLALPQASDQFRTAVKLQAAGAGRFLAEEVLPARIAMLVRVLLQDPVYRLNARRLQREIRSMPEPSECVPLLERVAATKRPVRTPDPFSSLALPSAVADLMRRET